MANIWLNSSDIANPTSFKIERYRITKSSRLANGDMSMDLIAKKVKFYLTWETMSSDDKKALMAQIWDTDEVFYEFKYSEDGEEKTSTVYAGSMPTGLAKENGANTIWKDVTVNLIEK